MNAWPMERLGRSEMMNAEQTETEKRDRAGRGGLCLITLSHAPFIIHRSSFGEWGFKPSLD